MTEAITFKTTQIGIFNPGRLSDEEIERAFITRIKIFEYLLQGLVTERPDAIPQHYLIIGQRGMGKSTLLHRIAVELRKEAHRKLFIPLTFPEEQYNVDRLSKFWLNCLDSLADALDREGSTNQLGQLDRDIRQWASQAKDISAMELYGHFAAWVKRIDRRPVLLVDNLGLVFDRLSKEEQHQLRAILMDNGAPILLGASANTIADTVDYGAPFYDAFQIQYLKKLTFEETQDVLRNLAEITKNPSFINEMATQRGRLRTLYQLTGGTPRTIVMLYPLIQGGFSLEVQNDLESLMDVMTPLYKARFEELSEQMQVILDAVALHWDPIALDDLRQITQLENPQLSPQLKRLVEVGWIERLDAYQKKGNAYQISERFFNIWYLMRRSNRRQKKDLLGLTELLVSLYGEGLQQIGEHLLLAKSLNKNHVGVQLAVAGGLKDKDLADKIRHKSYEELLEMLRSDSSILKDFAIPRQLVDEKVGSLQKEMQLIQKILDLINEKKWSKALEICGDTLKINPKSTLTWSLIAYLNADHFGNYAEAERNYMKALNIDRQYVRAWYGLGNLYQQHLGRYQDAEKSYLKAIEADVHHTDAWNNLGNLYQYHLGRYKDAEQTYLKAIDIDRQYPHAWNNLGNLYQYHLGRYEEAERAYLKAIETDGGYANAAWNNLGNFYQNIHGRYKEAEQAYMKAIEIDTENVISKMNLIFLYRDRMNRVKEARFFFDSIDEPKMGEDSYWLNASLFELYDANLGVAGRYLAKALNTTNGKLPYNTQEDWWRFAAVSLRLGYGEEILNILKKNGYDAILRPYYVAIQSILAKDSQAFLNSIAVEVREVAADLAERIKQII